MGSYRETNDEPEDFYIDSFGEGQQQEIIEVVRSIGGNVEYDRSAHHMGEARSRYKVTLPPGCEHVGLDGYMDPQSITLPGGPAMRKLCLYPQDDGVHIAWLPGDSTTVSLWNGAVRKLTLTGNEEAPTDTIEAKYYLAVGNVNVSRAEKLRDCTSDQIELVEVEAIEELEQQLAHGNEETIVRVVETSTRTVVFAVHRGNVNNFK